MTTTARRAIVAGVLTSVIGAAILGVMGAAWSGKVDKAEFDLRVQKIESAAVLTTTRDSLWKLEEREMVLDILCALRETDRRCK